MADPKHVDRNSSKCCVSGSIRSVPVVASTGSPQYLSTLQDDRVDLHLA